jgi:hypothetical protein
VGGHGKPSAGLESVMLAFTPQDDPSLPQNISSTARTRGKAAEARLTSGRCPRSAAPRASQRSPPWCWGRGTCNRGSHEEKRHWLRGKPAVCSLMGARHPAVWRAASQQPAGTLRVPPAPPASHLQYASPRMSRARWSAMAEPAPNCGSREQQPTKSLPRSRAQAAGHWLLDWSAPTPTPRCIQPGPCLRSAI